MMVLKLTANCPPVMTQPASTATALSMHLLTASSLVQFVFVSAKFNV